MWNEERLAELLKEMPEELTAENLAAIQQVIDNDKFINGKRKREEQCGKYAPFCKNCDKSVDKACAVAYVRTKIKEGVQVSMQGISSEVPEIAEDGSAVSVKKIRIAIAKNRS